MQRIFSLYEWVTSESDPRHTQGMAEADYHLVVAALDPDVMEASQIQRLGAYLRENREFLALAQRAGRDPESLCRDLDRFPFAEALHLFDRARLQVSQRAGEAPK